MFTLVLLLSGVSALFLGAQAEELDINTRILGGTHAFDGAATYMASLRFTKGFSHECGGSIISTRTILTAAHCVYGKGPSDYVVVVGTNRPDHGGQLHEVQHFIIHHDYSPYYNLNDIALVILRAPIRYTSLVQPIKIAHQPHHIEDNTKLYLTGWGKTSYPGEMSNSLKIIQLWTFNTRRCARIFLITSEICTLNGVGEGSCFGDSGGPLVDPSTKLQVGIVSRGSQRNCGIGQPDVFTRVSAFADWIQWNTL